MKVNYRRAIERERQKVWEAKQRAREEFLSKMTPTERAAFEEKEHQDAMDALKTLGLVQSMLGDSPYFKL